MREDFNSYYQKWNKSGIYAITIGGKVMYIGRAVNMYERIRKHKQEIFKGKEKKYKLLRQARFSGYYIQFEVVEYTEDIEEREAYYINYYLPPLNRQIPQHKDFEKQENLIKNINSYYEAIVKAKYLKEENTMNNNGKQGEQLFQQIMSRRKYIINNVSNNPCYWNKDIDFILKSPTTGAVKSFEVKWDKCIATTGNLYLETNNVNSRGGLGWWQFCQADYLAYGDATNKIFYIIPMEQLRERVKTLTLQKTNCGSDSTGLLLPLAAIQDITKIL